MSGIDLSKFQISKGLVEDSGLKGKEDRIIWLRYSKEEVAEFLAEMHLMAKAGLSDSISLRNRSKIAANCYYEIAKSLHVFAKIQAWTELGLSNDETEILFRHKSIFGRAKYEQLQIENP
ncbi:hypothetical protein [Ammoniphilus resinae]|uniref:Uncharacterized protein n=1 Tax=Ammoniphilus resinae TaxID=861532 RepID=A0ABS4GNP1_9BACL|nr:hypothetical protein [Ammoniphilus resinae]MBP1931893.1 hypothetical protein [Ammoniphilus resinae]